MDSLTQIVLGAATGEAVLGKKVGNKAILWGAIAGTIPDLDVLANLFTDPLTANEVHRGFSHSIVFSILFSPVFGWLINKIYKKKEATWKDWSMLMFWGMFTHPLLDAFTTWGTQLFWPFSFKVSFKNIFVVDPLYTVPFIVCVILAMFYKRNNPKRSKINWMGIYLSSGYLVVTLLLKWYTYGVFKQSLEDQNIDYLEIQTKPTPLNSILWNANIKTKDSYLIGSYSLFDKDKNVSFKAFKKNYHLLNGKENHPLIMRLIKLSENWYTLQKVGDELYFNDLRFGLLGDESSSTTFVFRYLLENDNNGDLKVIQSAQNPKDIKPMLKQLWQRILGNKFF